MPREVILSCEIHGEYCLSDVGFFGARGIEERHGLEKRGYDYRILNYYIIDTFFSELDTRVFDDDVNEISVHEYYCSLTEK